MPFGCHPKNVHILYPLFAKNVNNIMTILCHFIVYQWIIYSSIISIAIELMLFGFFYVSPSERQWKEEHNEISMGLNEEHMISCSIELGKVFSNGMIPLFYQN
jgi:hypothetical protein